MKIETRAFEGQRPGTSGLRKKTKVFMQDHYAENFIQSVFNAISVEDGEGLENKVLVAGGDGRFLNKEVIQKIIKMSVGNGISRLMVGKDGILSTPAASAVIRKHGTRGGFVLSASHNPGGENEDFGIKFNTPNGGPAPQSVTEAIFKHTTEISSYLIEDCEEVDLGTIGEVAIGDTVIQIFDPLEAYTEKMEEIFSFDQLRSLFQSGFRLCFDAMNAVTGPYAKHIFEGILGAPEGTVIRYEPLEDFGGLHPDPNLKHAAELVKAMYGEGAPDLGAASDGDGDRNLILGQKFFVTPGDSLAVIAEHAASAIPGYSKGLAGVARSMPTSMAVDKVAEKAGIECFETPTGWKFFCSLMDAGRCSICGEESFGTGSDHVREKDGLWAVLSWLSILAETGKSVATVSKDLWDKYGRSYFQRYDFEGLDLDSANEMFNEVRGQLDGLEGQPFWETTIKKADDFKYTDPINAEVAESQGIRFFLAEGSRVVFRLSGTGTSGATLRVYLERYEEEKTGEDASEMLKPLGDAVVEFLKLKERFGIDVPTVIT